MGARNRFNNDQKYLPLSVVLCDLNGLKNVNDTHGHQYGDLMLQIAADILYKTCPEYGFVARIGGDEFIFLLPQASSDTARELTEHINEELASCNKIPFTISVSLGTATKYSVDESLDEIIALADKHMYEDKWKTKIKLRSSDSDFTTLA